MNGEAKFKVESTSKQGGIYRRYFKRQMDIVLSLIALIVLSPILLMVAILVRIKLGSPIIFKRKKTRSK